MSVVLVTGASGFIGSKLVVRLLEEGNQVVALSRKILDVPGVTMVIGDFSDANTVKSLSTLGIDSVIHLGGVTGDALEEDALKVNVLGSSNLLRTLIELGIKKYIIASSIAVVGCLTADFMPRVLPIPDDHPCDSSNAYGLSKYFLEELCNYHFRLDSELDITLFRIGVVLKEDAEPAGIDRIEAMWRPFCTLGCIAVQDVVEAFNLASKKSLGSGVRIMNLVAKSSYSTVPTIEALGLSLRERAHQLNLNYYKEENNEFAGLYDISLLDKVLGFTPLIDLRTMRTR